MIVLAEALRLHASTILLILFSAFVVSEVRGLLWFVLDLVLRPQQALIVRLVLRVLLVASYQTSRVL